MSMEFCILASGSGGNCTVVRTPGGAILIDAGIGPRIAANRLNGTGVLVRHIKAICLTHLDRDHFTPVWANTIRALRIRVFCHRDRVDDLRELCPGELDENICPFEGAFEAVDGVGMHPIPLAHDRTGSYGFVIEGHGCRAGYATDLGRVPAELIERFVDLDLLALESNYDMQMQQDSGRPWFLKQRITGGRGHLSNDQALAAVRQILDRSQARGMRLPAHIVLLHRSRQCNCPNLVRRMFSRDARIAPRLTLAEQFRPTGWMRIRSPRAFIGEQFLLSWG